MQLFLIGFILTETGDGLSMASSSNLASSVPICAAILSKNRSGSFIVAAGSWAQEFYQVTNNDNEHTTNYIEPEVADQIQIID